MVVYVDILLSINFMVNYLLLRLTAQFSGEKLSGWRSALGAFVGALSALVVFLPSLSGTEWFLLRAVVCFLMIAVSFGFKGWRRMLRSAFLLVLSSVLVSGMLTAVSLTLRQDVMSVYRGVVYFDVGLPALMGAIVAAYLLSKLLSLLLWRRSPDDAICRATIVTPQGSCTVPALIDTGSSLVEPFSGDPVIVCDKESFPWLDDAVSKEGELSPGCRLIPYRTLGGEGVLRAFRPLFLRIETANGVFRCDSSFVAISKTPVGGGEICAILNPLILSRSVREEAVVG